MFFIPLHKSHRVVLCRLCLCCECQHSNDSRAHTTRAHHFISSRSALLTKSAGRRSRRRHIADVSGGGRHLLAVSCDDRREGCARRGGAAGTVGGRLLVGLARDAYAGRGHRLLEQRRAQLVARARGQVERCEPVDGAQCRVRRRVEHCTHALCVALHRRAHCDAAHHGIRTSYVVSM